MSNIAVALPGNIEGQPYSDTSPYKVSEYSMVKPENTHLLHKRNYHCTAGWFGFDQTCKSLSNSTQQSS